MHQYEWTDGTIDDLIYNFVIGKADLTITAKDKEITYGDVPANDGVTYSGFVNGETESVLDGTLDYDYNYAQYSGVGNAYTITPNGLTSDNYNISYVNGTLTVTQKEIGIDWTQPANLVYDGNAKVPTAAATGLVNSNSANITAQLSDSNDNINVGSFTYTATAVDNANYKLPISVTSDSYTITQATPTITNLTASRVRRGDALSTSTFTGGEAKDVGGAELAGTFAWDDGTEVMNINGIFSRKVVFTPTDTNYAPCEFDVDVEVYTPSSGGGTTRYTVKFETNGGSTVKSATVNRNGKVAEPDEPAKDGYVFDGWYTDKALTEKYDFESKITKSFTLYAKWVETEKEPEEDDNTGVKKWNPFIDVTENDWFHDVIKEAYLTGLVAGTSENTFSPDGDITRGMFVTILYRAEGEPVAPKLNFTDVASGWYYCDAIAWANANGIVKGVSEAEFAPDNNITREQMAAILFRYAQYKGMDAMTLAEHLGQFTDNSTITEYAASALNWAVGAGIISGKGNGILDPLGNATRAEATAVLVRFLDIIK